MTRHGEAEEEASCHHRNNQNSNSHFHCLAIRRRGDTPIMTHTTKPSQSHSFLFVSFSCPIIPTLKGKKKDDSSDAFSLIQNQKMQQQKQRQATKHSLSFYSDIRHHNIHHLFCFKDPSSHKKDPRRIKKHKASETHSSNIFCSNFSKGIINEEKR